LPICAEARPLETPATAFSRGENGNEPLKTQISRFLHSLGQERTSAASMCQRPISAFGGGAYPGDKAAAQAALIDAAAWEGTSPSLRW